jgi:CheY-like chemotaxis protein
MSCRVLWVDDEADTLLAEYMKPVKTAGHDLHIELDASNAIRRIEGGEFDLLILDLIIHAGHREDIRKYDRMAGKQKQEGYLGLQLIRNLLAPETADIRIPINSKWVTAEKIAVFSVVKDKDVIRELQGYGIKLIRSKLGADRIALLDLIESACK